MIRNLSILSRSVGHTVVWAVDVMSPKKMNLQGSTGQRRSSAPSSRNSPITDSTGKASSRGLIAGGKWSPKTHMNAESSTLLSSGGFTSQTREATVRCTDYLDWTPGETNKVLSYAFRDNQQLFAGASDLSPKPLSRVKSVTVSCLPRSVNAANATSGFVALYNTPALDSVNNETQTTGSQNTQRAVSQRSTMVNPTFAVDWVKIGSTNFDKTFRSGQLLPVRQDTTDATSSGLVLFELALISPDNGSAFKDSVQLKVDTVYSQPIVTATNQTVSAQYGTVFGAVQTPVYAAQFAQVELLGVTDVM